LSEPAQAPYTLEGLHGGWPFGPGPELWPVTVGWQEATPTGSQAAGAHLLCKECGQSVTRLGPWVHTLAGLKPQIAAHVMQVHLELVVR
jgi:hypothetical protein